MSDIIRTDQISYISSLRKEDDELLTELESYARSHSVPILDRNAALFLEQIVHVTKPIRALEIGTAIGYSAIRIARNLPEGGSVTTIEIDEACAVLAEENFRKSGLQEKITLLRGDAPEVLASIQEPFDFIFLDADKEEYERIFEIVYPLLKSGGVILVDNLLWHGYVATADVPEEYLSSTLAIRLFNEIFMRHPGLKSSILTIGDGLGLGMKL